jgi:hypothetical protein
MNTNRMDALHVSDEELVQLLDDELSAGLRVELMGHVFGCTGCSERLDELQEASRVFSGHLIALDRSVRVDEVARARALSAMRKAVTPVEKRAVKRFSFRYTRAAAAVALLVFGTLSVPPLRAWVAERVGIVATEIEELAIRPELPDATFVEPVVSFRPTEPVFLIELAHQQLSGSLMLESSERDLAAAQIVGRGGETLLVLPNGVRIENVPGSVAGYRVEVPSAIVSRIRIVAAGMMVAEIAPPPVGVTRPVDLAEDHTR